MCGVLETDARGGYVVGTVQEDARRLGEADVAMDQSTLFGRFDEGRPTSCRYTVEICFLARRQNHMLLLLPATRDDVISWRCFVALP
jgi:hypothetical protein